MAAGLSTSTPLQTPLKQDLYVTALYAETTHPEKSVELYNFIINPKDEEIMEPGDFRRWSKRIKTINSVNLEPPYSPAYVRIIKCHIFGIGMVIDKIRAFALLERYAAFIDKEEALWLKQQCRDDEAHYLDPSYLQLCVNAYETTKDLSIGYDLATTLVKQEKGGTEQMQQLQAALPSTSCMPKKDCIAVWFAAKFLLSKLETKYEGIAEVLWCAESAHLPCAEYALSDFYKDGSALLDVQDTLEYIMCIDTSKNGKVNQRPQTLLRAKIMQALPSPDPRDIWAYKVQDLIKSAASKRFQPAVKRYIAIALG